MSDTVPVNPDFDADCRAAFDAQPIMGTLGIRIVSVTPGACAMEMPFDPAYTQADGFLQAGMPAVLADNCGGCAMMSLMPAGARVVAVEFKINFLAPAVGDLLRAEARVIKSGRSLSITEVDVLAVKDTATTLVARMQQTGMRRDPR